ncbi:MAG: D-glycerate dehydrogenase, partial [Rhodospirillaceae bacterium]|nr:D-glycerate dehydrogenase [Rhodospirillaceae bacterium]
MTAKKPKIVVTRKLPDSVETRMMELFDVELNLSDEPMDTAQLQAALKTCDVLVPTVTDQISAEVLSEKGKNFRMIANYGAGVDHIDLSAARELGIVVTNTPDVLTEDTADMTMALILAVPRRLVEGEKALRQGKWNGWSPTWMNGHRIHGKRLG